ncbi:hypothetical protein KIH74_34800 [Kineosporia sp. J2-2]|uniref:Tetratricopeptide repeat protein n=1 Tax=Kineosporia corallincola TaxID=2835133 RepID=A0ABS5TTM2_9ACTN|nr:hypothetical protein [Kineosporia corallincola]MBT0774167.1 hypothetical protein [Kineosporia corallincola]
MPSNNSELWRIGNVLKEEHARLLPGDSFAFVFVSEHSIAAGGHATTDLDHVGWDVLAKRFRKDIIEDVPAEGNWYVAVSAPLARVKFLTMTGALKARNFTLLFADRTGVRRACPSPVDSGMQPTDTPWDEWSWASMTVTDQRLNDLRAARHRLAQHPDELLPRDWDARTQDAMTSLDVAIRVVPWLDGPSAQLWRYLTGFLDALHKPRAQVLLALWLYQQGRHTEAFTELAEAHRAVETDDRDQLRLDAFDEANFNREGSRIFVTLVGSLILEHADQTQIPVIVSSWIRHQAFHQSRDFGAPGAWDSSW